MARPKLSLSQWRKGFPEFDTAEDQLVQTKLNAAHLMFDVHLYGENYLDAVAYMTAEMLASSPFGTNARTEGDLTVYRSMLDRLAALVPATPLVVQHRRGSCRYR